MGTAVQGATYIKIVVPFTSCRICVRMKSIPGSTPFIKVWRIRTRNLQPEGCAPCAEQATDLRFEERKFSAFAFLPPLFYTRHE